MLPAATLRLLEAGLRAYGWNKSGYAPSHVSVNTVVMAYRNPITVAGAARELSVSLDMERRTRFTFHRLWATPEARENLGLYGMGVKRYIQAHDYK